MKSSASMRSIIVMAILAGAVAFALVAVGCFGGGDTADTTGTDALGEGGTLSTTLAEATTTVASFDALSSFKSKDPFVPQAIPTTTLAPATTVSTVVTTSTVRVTTTAPHRLTVTAFPGGGFVAFTINGDSFNSFQAGPAIFSGAWGTIQIVAVNDGAAPFTATFRRNGTVDFTLQLGQSRIW